MDSLDKLRELLQGYANETGETWLLLDGFRNMPGQSDPSQMTLSHGVPLKYATTKEQAQAIEEIRPSGMQGPSNT